MSYWNEDHKHTYWNPYFGGFMLGLLLIFTFYVTGRGLGASGAMKSTVVFALYEVAPTHVEKSAYYSRFVEEEKSPLNTWLIFEVLGVVAGAFLSGALSGRAKFRIQHSPKITSKKRVVFALIGGMLFGFGSQMARGCTSGAALSGLTVMATAGFITMGTIFGSGYLFAYFFRKNWL